MPDADSSLPPLQFGLLAPGDTPLLVRLVRDCYGDSYAHGYFYDSNTLHQLIEDGMLYCAVATDPDGRVVAHMAVKLEYRGDRTADNFAGMMLPEYRGKGVLMQLGTILFPVYESLQLYGLQTATVTHHVFSQKISSNTGTVTVGCLLADSPGSNADGLQIAHRMPILMQFCPLRALAARHIYTTPDYLPLLQQVYRSLQCAVTVVDGIDPVLPASTTEQHVDHRRSTALLRFHTIGNDLASQIATFAQATHDVQVSYIDVPLACPTAPALMRAANADGWWFGGVIFGRAGTDVLRLQRCALPPSTSRDGIIDAASRDMVEQILRDHHRVSHRSRA